MYDRHSCVRLQRALFIVFLVMCTSLDAGQGDEPVGLPSEFVLEPAKRVPVAYDVDVVVAGGGFSGIAAALASARAGAETVLIERPGIVGGSFGPGMTSKLVF